MNNFQIKTNANRNTDKTNRRFLQLVESAKVTNMLLIGILVCGLIVTGWIVITEIRIQKAYMAIDNIGKSFGGLE